MIKRFISWLFLNRFEKELSKEIDRLEIKSKDNKYDFHCAICGDIETIELESPPQSKRNAKGHLLFECYTCYFAGAVLRGKKLKGQ